MIKVSKGDLIQNAINGKYDAIAHGCNCFCTMGAGIAASVKKQFPNAYNVDKATDFGSINKLGTLTFSNEIYDVPFTVFNLYTQFDFGFRNKNLPPIDYEALALTLRKMAYILTDEKSSVIKSIGLPLIGYGLAGGDLTTIIKIFCQELTNFDVEIVVYEHEHNADELIEKITELIK